MAEKAEIEQRLMLECMDCSGKIVGGPDQPTMVVTEIDAKEGYAIWKCRTCGKQTRLWVSGLSSLL